METRKRKRSSILKKPGPGSGESSPTQTFTRTNNRRISFSGKNNVKEFTTGIDKETIWGSSYEESAENILQTTNQTSSVEDQKQVEAKVEVPKNKNVPILKKYNLRNSVVVEAPVIVAHPPPVKTLNVFKGIEKNKTVDMNISVLKKSTRNTCHFIDESAELEISQNVLTAIDKKKQRKTINFINGEEIAEEIDKSKGQDSEIASEITPPPNKMTKIDQSFSFLSNEEADGYTFIDSNDFDFTKQSFLNRKSDSSFLHRNQSQTENSLRKSVILKKSSVKDICLEVSESDKENIISPNLETITEVKDMSLTAETSLGAIPKNPSLNRRTILQHENMDETKIASDQSFPTGKIKKIPSVFRKTILQPQNMDVTTKTENKTVYQPQDMIESDEDVFEDAECILEEKFNFKSIYVADMDLCSPTECQHEEKPKSLKNRRTIHTTEEMDIMSPVKSFENSNFSQDLSSDIYLLENLVNDVRHSKATSSKIPEVIETQTTHLTMQEMAANYCKENNITESTISDSNSVIMKLTNPNIRRRTIESIYEVDKITKTRKRVSTNIIVETSLDDDLEKLNTSNIRKTIYSVAPMNITLAESPKTSHVNQISEESFHRMNITEVTDESFRPLSVFNRRTISTAEPINITLGVDRKSEQVDEKCKTISLEESMNLCEENSNEIISGVGSKRKTTHFHESMNLTGLLNQSRKSCINLKRKTIHDLEEMNMTEINSGPTVSEHIVKEKIITRQAAIFESVDQSLQDMDVSSAIMTDSLVSEKQQDTNKINQATTIKNRQTIIFPENESIQESFQENLTENTFGLSIPRHAIQRNDRSTNISLAVNPNMTDDESIKHKLTSTAINNVTFNPDSRDATDVIFSVVKNSNISVPNNFAGIFNKLQNTNSITMQSGTDSAFSLNTTEALCSKQIQTIGETPIKSKIPIPVTPNMRGRNKTSISSRNLSLEFKKDELLNETCSCSPKNMLKTDASYKRDFIDLTIGRLSDSMLPSSSSSSNDIDKTEMNLIQSTFDDESISIVKNVEDVCTTCKDCNKKFVVPVFEKLKGEQDVELLKANIAINNCFRNAAEDFFFKMSIKKKKIVPPEPVMFPSVPSITFLAENYIKTRSEDLILASKKERFIGAFLPEIPFFEKLLKNKIECTGWKLCRLLFSYGLIELTHRDLPGINIKFSMVCDKNGRVGLRQNKYNFEKIELFVSRKRVFISSKILLHSEFIKKLPNDLLLSCPSTDQIFEFVDQINTNYQKSLADTTALIEILNEHNAVLAHYKDDSDFSCFIKCVVISITEMKLYDVSIDINRICEIGHRNISIEPNVEFLDNLNNFDVGLPFLNSFLGNVKSYLKL